MTARRNWKDVFRDAMFESSDLQQRNIHRDLLEFLVHRANMKSRSCWVSRREMARIKNCSVRNIKDLIRDLRDFGVVFQVRFSELPPKDQRDINAISPRPMKGTANVYHLSLGWAEDVLSERRSENIRPGTIAISEADRKRGAATGNDKRRRYGPMNDISDIDVSTSPEHEDWLVLNAVGLKGDVPSTPVKYGKGDVPTTDISTEYKKASSISNISGSIADLSVLHSREKASRTVISSLMVTPISADQQGCGGGEAFAPVPSPEGLARPEGTEYDAARASDRRAS